jgi:hypothetical protein
MSALFVVVVLTGAPYPGALYLRVPLGARPAALGGAFCAMADDATAIGWNPAGLARLRRNEVSLTHNRWFVSARLNNASAAWRVGRMVALGTAVTHVGHGVLPVYDAWGSRTGEFAPYAAMASLALGIGARGTADTATGNRRLVVTRTFPVSFGVGLKALVERTWDTNIQAWACDVAARWYLTDRIELGMAAGNLGRYLSAADAGTPLPATIRAGFCGRVGTDALVVAGDIAWTREQRFAGHAGVEMGTTGFRLRGGLTTGTAGQTLGLTAGVGLVMGWLKVDYAYAPNPTLGATHQIGLGFIF